MYLHIAASSLASAYRQTTAINDKLLPYANLKRIFEGNINSIPPRSQCDTRSKHFIFFSKFESRETLIYSIVTSCGMLEQL